VKTSLFNSDADIQNVDRLIHEPNRLMIMAQLYVVESADFLFLQHQTEMSSGNLSTHLKKLERAGYIDVTKEYIDRKPHTTLALTTKGREAFKQYRKRVKQFVEKIPDEVFDK